MSDAGLRELERRFRETGSVEDEAAWLRARVQAGELEQERVELAARLGHESALRMTGAVHPEGESLEWVESAEKALPEAVVQRLVAALARMVLPIAIAADPPYESALIRLCDLQDLRVLEGAARKEEILEAQDACNGLAAEGDEILAVELIGWLGDYPVHALRQAAYLYDLESLLVGIRVELVPWALGYSDPIRDRVEARQRAEAAGD